MPRPRRQRQSTLEEPAVNLTPLIDVVFVILIMFILIAPLLDLDRVDLAQAGGDPADSRPVNEAGPIAIHVHKDNTIWLNNKKVTVEQLPSLLSETKKRHPKARPQLYHDKKAHFGTYQSVKNSAERAGFKELDIILKPS